MKKCKFCKKEIPLKKKHNKFCNSSCAASFNNKGVKRNSSSKTLPVNNCLHCGKDTSNPKFCNNSCSASFNNRGIRRNISLGNRPTNNCLYCKKETFNSKYCSAGCHREHKRKTIFDTIEKTGILPSSPMGRIRSTGKNYLITTRGHKCEDCLNSLWKDKPIALEMHHSNGDPDDNKVSNVLLLCPNCHSCTPSFKGKNKPGKGRWSKRNVIRRERYSSGKSS